MGEEGGVWMLKGLKKYSCSVINSYVLSKVALGDSSRTSASRPNNSSWHFQHQGALVVKTVYVFMTGDGPKMVNFGPKMAKNGKLVNDPKWSKRVQK